MTSQVPLKCKCGSLRGVAIGISKSTGNRIVCMCDDCQAYAHFLGRAKDVLDENGGTDVSPVTPASLMFTHGIEYLRCLRLTSKGMLRWYAGCCETPVANTAASHKVPFAGMIHTIFDIDEDRDGISREEALGPIYGRVQGKYGMGNLPKGTNRTTSFKHLFSALRFLIPALIRGQNAPSPFFDSRSGEPIVEPYTLTPEERESLRKYCGPNVMP